MTSFRQGDLLLVAIREIPPQAAPVAAARQRGSRRLVIARGEATGHAHTLPAVPGIRLLRTASAGYLEVRMASALLSHEQHRALPIPAGRYRIIMQRQYDPAAAGARAVAD